MYRINLGISRLQPPNRPAPPRGTAYVYAIRDGARQLVTAPLSGRRLALFAEETP